MMSSLDLNKLKRKKLPEVSERPKKKIDRFDGLSEEEVQKFTLEDYLEMNLDLVFVGINPSLMAAHRGRYYAGPGNHFYKLLHESGLTPRFVSFEEDYKLLQYSIGLTNIVTRPTRSAADLKRTEIKEGAKVVEEKLKLYKPKVAVFNGKCIYEVFANIRANAKFHFGLQPECVGDTAIWVTPSSSARCANFPRMVDKLHFHTALKKYLQFLKGEITNVDVKEFQFEGKCKQSVPSTSKMWRRKDISTFLHGGRVVNKNTLCLDTSEEDIAAIHTAEFLVEKANHKKYTEDEDRCNHENENRALFDKIAEKTEKDMGKTDKIVISGHVNNGTVIANRSKKEASNTNRREGSNHTFLERSRCRGQPIALHFSASAETKRAIGCRVVSCRVTRAGANKRIREVIASAKRSYDSVSLPLVRIFGESFWYDQKMTNAMQLQIRGQETTVIDCVDNDRIQHIKKRIASLHGIVDEFNLYCNGSLLIDEACVGELPSNVLDLTVPLRGGKVHGSLARAGKVKAQTPKVEKQEKSKKKTGRAKRRIQYNRRFVNVVQTFGRRRGPNANTNT